MVTSQNLHGLSRALAESKEAVKDSVISRGLALSAQLMQRVAVSRPLHVGNAGLAIEALQDANRLADAHDVLHLVAQQLDACYQEKILHSTDTLGLLASLAEKWHRRTHPQSIAEHGNDVEWYLLGRKHARGLPEWLLTVYAETLSHVPRHAPARTGLELWQKQFDVNTMQALSK